MWQCDNCGYTDEEGTTFEMHNEQDEDTDDEEEVVQYCPECGSDEVFLVDEDPEEEDLADSALEGDNDDTDWDGDPAEGKDWD